jgi:hypothetical protein
MNAQSHQKHRDEERVLSQELADAGDDLTETVERGVDHWSRVRRDGDIGWLHEDEIGVDAHAARVDGATNVQDTIH